MKNRIQEAQALCNGDIKFVIPSGDEKHLGGSITGYGIGDPATYYPNMWTWAVGILDAKSVLDVGCGQGFSLEYFAKLGLRAKGIEGYEESIKNGRRPDLVTKHDYEKAPLTLDETFDMAWCCEFVEHIEEKCMDNFFATFKSAKTIFMTFATPGQGGHHHVNEQPGEYWVDAFQKRGFTLNIDLTNCARIVAHADCKIFSPQFKSHFIDKGLVFTNNAFD
ncbi:MAG: methyltransferase domain-containing protein [Alphaproteobacteria bacterium]